MINIDISNRCAMCQRTFLLFRDHRDWSRARDNLERSPRGWTNIFPLNRKCSNVDDVLIFTFSWISVSNIYLFKQTLNFNFWQTRQVRWYEREMLNNDGVNRSFSSSHSAVFRKLKLNRGEGKHERRDYRVFCFQAIPALKPFIISVLFVCFMET